MNKENNIQKTVPIFKISLFEDEDEMLELDGKDEYYVYVQPRLSTFDSFKDAIYDRFPMLKDRSLYMFFYGEHCQNSFHF